MFYVLCRNDLVMIQELSSLMSEKFLFGVKVVIVFNIIKFKIIIIIKGKICFNKDPTGTY